MSTIEWTGENETDLDEVEFEWRVLCRVGDNVLNISWGHIVMTSPEWLHFLTYNTSLSTNTFTWCKNHENK